MSSNRVLLGSRAFMDDFRERALIAKKSLYVQAMTFEGDDAGKELIDIMLRSPAKDKKLLVDQYSNAVINDSFIISPKFLKDRDFRAEVSNTKRILKLAQEKGIEVIFTNPLGFLMLRYPLRNHKKMVVVDEEITYLGGINFSDHNFEWHDMMIALEDPSIGACVAEDVEKTRNGINQSVAKELGDSTLYFFNGVKSKDLYDRLFDTIKSAKKSVEIISPYVSNPLLSIVEKAAKNGVEVSIISPEKNNKSIFKGILLSELKKGYFKMFEYPGMSHLKAILVDGERLLFGSSNYDIVSYYWEQEVVLVSKNEELVEMFKKQVLNEAKRDAKLVAGEDGGAAAAVVMSALEKFCKITSKSILRPN